MTTVEPSSLVIETLPPVTVVVTPDELVVVCVVAGWIGIVVLKPETPTSDNTYCPEEFE